MIKRDVTFTKGSGGLGRALAGEDHISGIVFYSATLPSGFTTNDRIKKVFSVKDAEALGVSKTGFTGIHYHISEYFRIQPKGVLYTSINAVPSSYTFTEVAEIQNFAEGKIRQVAVWADALTFSGSQVTTLNGVAKTLSDENKGLSVLYSANFSGSTLSTLPDLSAMNAEYVSVVIGEDSGAEGKAIRTSTNKSVSCIGAALGAVSLAAVHESIGWVKKFNMVTGAELDVVGFTTGELFKNVSESQLETLTSNAYIFLRKRYDVSGSYFPDGPTCTLASSDYAYIENNRTIEKAKRSIRSAVIPELNSPLYTKKGKVAEDTVVKFELLVKTPLESMVAAGEISEFSVTINPDQNVVASSKLEIGVSIVPVGVARQIDFQLGFALK